MALSTYQLKCPNCGADLDAEDGIESFFCKYCGTKIVLQGQSDAVVKAKANVQIADRVVAMRDKRYEYKRYKAEQARKEQEEARKKAPVYLGILLAIIIFGFGFLFIQVKNERAERQVKQLKVVLADIQKDINSGDYDGAMIKANQLYYTATNSAELREQWDKTRESVIQTIHDAREQ